MEQNKSVVVQSYRQGSHCRMAGLAFHLVAATEYPTRNGLNSEGIIFLTEQDLQRPAFGDCCCGSVVFVLPHPILWRWMMASCSGHTCWRRPGVGSDSGSSIQKAQALPSILGRLHQQRSHQLNCHISHFGYKGGLETVLNWAQHCVPNKLGFC